MSRTVSDSYQERRLKPIYEFLDSGNFRRALQESERLLKKQPDFLVAKALKSLSFIRLGRVDEASPLLSEVCNSDSIDHLTIQALTYCFREMGEPEKLVTLYQKVSKSQPNNEDFLSQLAISYGRIGEYKMQSLTSMQLYKLKPEQPLYYFWSVMCNVLQADSQPELARTVYLPLAAKMTEKFIKSNEESISGSQIQMYLHILERQERWHDLINFLDGDLCFKRPSLNDCATVYRIKALTALHMHHDVLKLCQAQIRKQPGHLFHWEHMTSAMLRILEKDMNAKQSVISGVVALMNEQVSMSLTYPQNVKQSRTQQLSRLNIIARLLEYGHVSPSELGTWDLSEPSELIAQFFDMFGSSPSVFRDIVPFFSLLGEEKREQFIERLRRSVSDLPVLPTPGKSLVISRDLETTMRHVNLLHLCCALGYYSGLSVEHRQALIKQSMEYYAQVQPSQQEESLNGNHMVSSGYLLFACCHLWELFAENEDEQLLLKAAILLDEGLRCDKSNTVFRILLIKVYALLGSPCCLTAEFNALDAKYILVDGLWYLISDQMSIFGFFRQYVQWTESCMKFYVSTVRDTTDCFLLAFKSGSFVKALEISRLRCDLRNAANHYLCRVDNVYYRLLTEFDSFEEVKNHMQGKLECSSIFQDDFDSVAKIDRRDFSVIPVLANVNERSVLDDWNQHVFQQMVNRTHYHYWILRLFRAVFKVEVNTSCVHDGRSQKLSESQDNLLTSTNGSTTELNSQCVNNTLDEAFSCLRILKALLKQWRDDGPQFHRRYTFYGCPPCHFAVYVTKCYVDVLLSRKGGDASSGENDCSSSVTSELSIFPKDEDLQKSLRAMFACHQLKDTPSGMFPYMQFVHVSMLMETLCLCLLMCSAVRFLTTSARLDIVKKGKKKRTCQADSRLGDLFEQFDNFSSILVLASESPEKLISDLQVMLDIDLSLLSTVRKDVSSVEGDLYTKSNVVAKLRAGYGQSLEELTFMSAHLRNIARNVEQWQDGAKVNMSSVQLVKPEVFSCISKFDIANLKRTCSPEDIVPVYPFLVGAFLSQRTAAFEDKEQPGNMFDHLLQDPRANAILSLFDADFANVAFELKRDSSVCTGSTIMAQNSVVGLRFETGTSDEKLYLVGAELLAASVFVKTLSSNPDVYVEAIRGGTTDVHCRSFDPSDNAQLFDEYCATVYLAGLCLSDLFSWEDLVEALLLYKNGPVAVQRMVANEPSIYHIVVRTLIENANTSMEPSPNYLSVYENRERALAHLCSMEPKRIHDIIEHCAELRRFPGFIIRTALQCLPFHYFATFLSGNLLMKKSQSCTWFTYFVQVAQKPDSRYNSVVKNLSNALFLQVENLLKEVEANGVMPLSRTQQASELLELICKLRCTSGLRFKDDDMRSLIRLACSRVAIGPAGASFISSGLMTLVVISILPNDLFLMLESTITSWIDWVVVSEDAFEQHLRELRRSYSELLMLLALHLDANYSEGIEELVQQVLDLSITVRASHMDRLRSILTDKVLNEMYIVERAAKVRVTPQLNADSEGFLAVYCVIELLGCRAFSKHQVVISDWIYDQLCECTLPLHGAIVKLIDAYVDSCFLPPSSKVQFTRKPNVPIAETKLIDFFTNTTLRREHVVQQVLLCYYVLRCEYVYWTNLRRISLAGMSSNVYSGKVMDSIPLMYLVNHVTQHSASYTPVLAVLDELVATQYAYLFINCLDPPLEQVCCTESEAAVVPTAEEIISVAKDSFRNPVRSLAMIKYLLRVPSDHSAELLPRIALYSRYLLDARVPEELLVYYRKLWSKAERFFPRKLYCCTSGALYYGYNEMTGVFRSESFCLSHTDLCADPLMTLRCDKRVFRCPIILDIVLRILRCYLSANRLHMERQLASFLCSPGLISKSPEEVVSIEGTQREIMRALVSTVQTACAQILLEACMPLEGEEQTDSPASVLPEVKSTVCSFLHRIFLANPDLIKVIHMQGYHPSLISTTVRSIPSMHVCLCFIPEMLRKGSLKRKIFALSLLAALCEQYTIPEARRAALIAFKILVTVASRLPVNKVVDFFTDAIDSLLRIARVIPTYSMDAAKLLVIVARICRVIVPVHSLELLRIRADKAGPLEPSVTKAAALFLKIHDALGGDLIRSVLDSTC
uniref:N-terminal acetyltransferase B complex subunit MDM20 homolog n=1 Tax=Trichuris muris TaxID=70415 RepID=A0A5S6QQF6_TRIMR